MIVLALPPSRSVHLWSSAASITPDAQSVGIHKSWSCLPGPHAFRSHQTFSGLGETQSEAPLRLGKPCAFPQGLKEAAPCLLRKASAFLGVQHSYAPADGAPAPFRRHPSLQGALGVFPLGMCPKLRSSDSARDERINVQMTEYKYREQDTY